MRSFSEKFEHIKDMRLALKKESDRGASLLSISFLENQLEDLLRNFFVKSTKIHKKIFEGYGSLATFSSKIDMSYLLGLISKDSYDDLNLMRKVRNEFAHSPQLINFNNDRITNICKNLKNHYRDKEENSRDIFVTTVCGIIGKILSKEMNMNRIVEHKDEQSLEEFKKHIRMDEQMLEKNLEEYKIMLNEFYGDEPKKEKFIKEHVEEYIQDLYSAMSITLKKIDEQVNTIKS